MANNGGIRTGTGERRLTTRQNGNRRDAGNGAKGEIEDNGECSGELGEITSQSDVDGGGRFEEGGGRVGQDAIV